jgi:hypothetical protein
MINNDYVKNTGKSKNWSLPLLFLDVFSKDNYFPVTNT